MSTMEKVRNNSRDKSKHEIIRVEKTAGDFAIIHKGFLADSNLSYKAKGILAYCLSKHDNWRIVVTDLAKHCTDGRSAIYSGLKELKEHGYYQKNPVWNERGKISHWEGVLSETPIKSASQPDVDFQDVENQDVENQNIENQDIENQDIENRQRSNNYFSNNDFSNNDLKESEREYPHPRACKHNTQKTLFSECVRLTEDEYARIVQQVGEDGAKWCIDKLCAYKRGCGKEYSSDYAAIQKWVFDAYEEHVAKQTKPTKPTKPTPRAFEKPLTHTKFQNYKPRENDYATLAAQNDRYFENMTKGANGSDLWERMKKAKRERMSEYST